MPTLCRASSARTRERNVIVVSCVLDTFFLPGHGPTRFLHGGTVFRHGETPLRYGGTAFLHRGTPLLQGGAPLSHGETPFLYDATPFPHGEPAFSHSETAFSHGGKTETHGGTRDIHDGTGRTHDLAGETPDLAVETHGLTVEIQGTLDGTVGNQVRAGGIRDAGAKILDGTGEPVRAGAWPVVAAYYTVVAFAILVAFPMNGASGGRMFACVALVLGPVVALFLLAARPYTDTDSTRSSRPQAGFGA